VTMDVPKILALLKDLARPTALALSEGADTGGAGGAPTVSDSLINFVVPHQEQQNWC